MALTVPAAQPALLASVGEQPLRWIYLCFVDALCNEREQTPSLELLLPEEAADLNDLVSGLLELMIGGLADNQELVGEAQAFLLQECAAVQLDSAGRAHWLRVWARTLKRRRVAAAPAQALWLWMAEFTGYWLPEGSDSTLDYPQELFA